MDPLAPHAMLQDPMMSALSSTVIAYFVDMVSRQVWQHEMKNDVISTITKLY